MHNPTRADDRAESRAGSNATAGGVLTGAMQFFKKKNSKRQAKKLNEKDSEWAALLKLWVVLVWLIVFAFFLSQTEWDWLSSSWFVGIVVPIICAYIGATLLSYIV